MLASNIADNKPKQVLYRCLQCHIQQTLLSKEAVRCKSCGYRILSKEATHKRVYLAR